MDKQKQQRPIARITWPNRRYVLVKWPKSRPGLTYGILKYEGSCFVFDMPTGGHYSKVKENMRVDLEPLTVCYVCLVGSYKLCLQEFSNRVNLDKRLTAVDDDDEL
jgi:hypothetical protein